MDSGNIGKQSTKRSHLDRSPLLMQTKQPQLIAHPSHNPVISKQIIVRVRETQTAQAAQHYSGNFRPAFFARSRTVCTTTCSAFGSNSPALPEYKPRVS